MEKKKKSFKLPHVYILMATVMLFIVLLSFIVPSGEMGKVLDPETGRMIANPQDFTVIEDVERITVLDFFKSIQIGMLRSGDIVIMLCLAAGAIYIVEQSGAIQAGIEALLRVSEGKEYIIMALLTIVFSILGTSGISEEMIPMIPLIISVFTGMGFDKFVGLGIVLMGIDIGFSTGVLNLYTTGISQQLVGLPMYSGLWFRLIGLILFNIIVIAYIIRYAKKIKADPSKSICEDYANQRVQQETVEASNIEFDLPKKIVLFGLIFTFLFQAYGAIKLDWDLADISAIYIIYAIVAAILLRVKPETACKQFATGASSLFPSAITVGMARAIMVLMEQAKIIDTAVYGLANTLQNKPPLLILLLVYLSVIIFNFFVTSGSGKAVILMPILEPLGQLVGINQQVMVLIFNYGDGITNYLWPTAGTMMACLGMAEVEWTDWIKFAGKLFAMLLTAGFILVVIAFKIDLGPF